MGARESTPSRAAAAVVGVAGRERPAGAHRGGRGRWPGRPLRGHRRLQAPHGAAAAWAGQSGSSRVADERRRGRPAGPFPPIVGKRNRVGGGLAPGRVGAALRLRPGRFGAAVRPQRELGVAEAGAGGGVAGRNPAPGSRRQDCGAGGDEVSGAGGAHQLRSLPADGCHIRPVSLRNAGGGSTVYRLAQGIAGNPSTYSRCTRSVFQNPASDPGENSRRHRRRTTTRSGDDRGDCEPRAATADGSRRRGTGYAAKQGCTVSDRAHSEATLPHRRDHPTGEGTAC